MLKKKFFKTKDVCDVTFMLPKEVKAKSAAVAGDFNSWDPTATPLKKVKGTWKTTLRLDKGQEYQYRFVVNDSEWLTDKEADKYVPNNVDGENSVVVTSNGH